MTPANAAQRDGAVVLAINGGSSSIKFALYRRGATLAQSLSGGIDRIGLAEAKFSFREAPDQTSDSRPVDARDFATAIRFLLDWLDERVGLASLDAVGHRVVHGMQHAQPERVTPELLAELRRIIPIDPDHLPAEIALVEAFARGCRTCRRSPVSTRPFIARCRARLRCCRFRAAMRRKASSDMVFTDCRTPF